MTTHPACAIRSSALRNPPAAYYHTFLTHCIASIATLSLRYGLPCVSTFPYADRSPRPWTPPFFPYPPSFHTPHLLHALSTAGLELAPRPRRREPTISSDAQCRMHFVDDTLPV